MSLRKMLVTWFFFSEENDFLLDPAQNSMRNSVVPSDFIFYRSVKKTYKNKF